MSITYILHLWEILRAINDRPYEKTGIFSIEDVGALRERPQTAIRKMLRWIGGEDGERCERCLWQIKRAERVSPQREGSPV